MAVQSVRARYLVRRARDMRRIVVAVARLVVAVCEDSQLWLRLGRYELRFRASVVESLLAGIELEVRAFLDGPAETLSA
jgi:hypothetical protein